MCYFSGANASPGKRQLLDTLRAKSFLVEDNYLLRTSAGTSRSNSTGAITREDPDKIDVAPMDGSLHGDD